MLKRVIGIFLLIGIIGGLAACGHVHVYGEWKSIHEATCTDYGYDVRYCECGESELKYHKSLDHCFKEETENGVKICINCGITEPGTQSTVPEVTQPATVAQMQESFPLWEPSFSTEEYTVAIGRNNVSLDMGYSEFLAMYFDKYLGNQDGYTVTKYSLGKDSSGQYDVMAYDFVPDGYSKTVLISAGMNTCGLSPMWGLAYFMQAVMEQYDQDEGLEYIRKNVRIKIIPVLCPWSFDQTPMKYSNFNDVRINKNFSHKESWELMETTDGNTRGTAPDSEAETVILKNWVTEHTGQADLWIDAHCDPDNNKPYLNSIFCSHTEMTPVVDSVQKRMKAYYIEKGTCTQEETVGSATAPLGVYPKTVYAHEVCNIDAIMIEQYPNGTAYGGDPTLANDDADIRNYVLMLRAYTLALL